MYYQTIDDDNNTREMISTWAGYNHNYVINDGELYDMENLSSDNYPVMTPRDKRALLVETDNVRGIIITDNNLTYLDGNNVLHYGTSHTYDLSEYFKKDDGTYDISSQTLVRFGAYIIAFPSGVYCNVATENEMGSITQVYKAPSGTTITMSICSLTGDELQNLVADETAPESPSNGDYWLNTTKDEQGLYIWSGTQSTWEAVATCYIKISIPGAKLTERFTTNDAVWLNTTLPDINEGSLIKAIGDDYIVVVGFMDVAQNSEVTDDIWTLKIQRKIPELDMVCVSNNRVWGCHYGNDYEGNVTNEIYASRLGDFKNWYTYAGLSTDSYSLSVGEPGEWTGCINYQGYPTFFKEGCVMKIYGDYPSQYQLTTHTCRGVQKGSEKSLAVVNEYLVYKSVSDVCIYDGSSPTGISSAFGRGTQYYNAVAAGCLGKYYISMEDYLGRTFNAVYDMDRGYWTKNDGKVKYSQFTQTESGQIYGTDGTRIFGIGVNDNIVFHSQLPYEDEVKWMAETGDMGFDQPDYKYVNSISIRAYLPFKSEITLQLRVDDEDWQDLGTYRGTGQTKVIHVCRFPDRCDHYKIRMSGHGKVRIYSLTRTYETASEECNGHTH